jgi:hypothetical protein
LEFSFISMFRWRVRDRISVGGGRLFGLDTMAAQEIKDDLFVLSGQGGHHHLLVLTAHEVDAGFFRQSEDVAPGVSIAGGILGDQLLDPGGSRGNKFRACARPNLCAQRLLEQRPQVCEAWYFAFLTARIPA